MTDTSAVAPPTKSPSRNTWQATPFTHLVDGVRGVYGAHLAVFLIQFNDWSGRLQVGLDSTGNTWRVYWGQMTEGTQKRQIRSKTHTRR